MTTLKERAEFYNKAFAKYPDSHLQVEKRFITGTWMIGACYKNDSNLYGAYPHGYLKRIMTLFPDVKDILHLFSGSVKSSQTATRREWTFDIKEDMNPDVVGDAHELYKYWASRKFDVIFADTPYSEEDANHYGTPMVNRNKVVKECYKVLKVGGFLVWLDQVYPMYRKTELKLVGTIGLIRSTNHRVRMVFIYQKVKNHA